MRTTKGTQHIGTRAMLTCSATAITAGRQTEASFSKETQVDVVRAATRNRGSTSYLHRNCPLLHQAEQQTSATKRADTRTARTRAAKRGVRSGSGLQQWPKWVERQTRSISTRHASCCTKANSGVSSSAISERGERRADGARHASGGGKRLVHLASRTSLLLHETQNANTAENEQAGSSTS